ncbi:MAG: 16S rRNA (guanine(527)-N(7))-methyltransferase RsmG [Gammaproteobacteria bacterium]|nr:16S rRNA (guanine(527)-N(7))-methyltransferase RsmG [Gammaproteobacteria bacterium]
MSDTTSIHEKLCQGLQELNLAASDRQIEQLLLYVALLKKWNQAFNLTAIDDTLEMVTLHLLDSLAIAPFVDKNGHHIDVGTGAGLPGIPLAIWYPEAGFTLLDSNSKKTRFLTQACHELKLTNVTVVHSRAEAYQPPELFDSVLSRAFSSLALMLKVTQHLCAKKGCFLAMKGIAPEKELAELSTHYSIRNQRLKLPFLSAERHLICIINQ